MTTTEPVIGAEPAPVVPGSVQETVAVPTETPVTNPDEFTVAIPVLDESQFPVQRMVESFAGPKSPLAKTICAFNCWEAVPFKLGAFGVMFRWSAFEEQMPRLTLVACETGQV